MEVRIKSFPYYTIDELGNVFSYHNNRKTKLKGFVNRGGYVYVDLCHNNHKERKAVHRLVAEYFVDGYFVGAVVNHKDGNPENNNAQNLEWITQRENIHKGYITSGLGATRNYHKYKIIFPDKSLSEEFIGFPSVVKFLKRENINISYSSLEKYGKTSGYEILKY